MTRDEAREHLIMGAELDGLVLTGQGRVVARGKVRWEGTILSAVETATCASLQLAMNGNRLDVPLVEPVVVRKGEALEIKFGPKWQRQQRRA